MILIQKLYKNNLSLQNYHQDNLMFIINSKNQLAKNNLEPQNTLIPNIL